nr:MAG: replication associated protein [Virus sp.]
MNFTLHAKNFIFTYPQCDVALDFILEYIKLKFLELDAKVVKWCVASEKHQDGNLHRHAFIGLESNVRAKININFFDCNGFHPNIQAARSAKAVIKYCKKEGEYISNIDGEVNDGDREQVAKLLLDGIQVAEIVRRWPRYLFGYKRLKEDVQSFIVDTKESECRSNPVGIWISGPSGCGKSTIAQTRMGRVYIKNCSKWWDGFNKHESAVCEDVDKSWRDFLPCFKIWADRYDFTGEIKGGSVSIRLTKFIVTSNRTVQELLTDLSWPRDDWDPYIRRFREYRITSIDDWESQL